MKMLMKIFKTMLCTLVLALTTSAFAANSVATLNGVYSFQVIGVSPQWGYYNGNTWVNVNGNCPNPQSKGGCINLSFAKITVGTISMDGKGHAKFLNFVNYGQQGQGGGGPVVGTVYPYKVSGWNGSLTVTGPKGGTVSMVLGGISSAGVATVIQFLIPDNNPSIGTAILEGSTK